MVSATGVRIGWADLPQKVWVAVEEILGASVVEAVSQSGGFSPGSADRVRTAAGGRAFVKAAGLDLNPHTPQLHRREARITAALPAAVPAPRLLGHYDDGDWVALVLQDVDGTHPATPWRADQLHALMAALERLADATTPAPLAGLPRACEDLTEDFGGWRRLRQEPPPGLSPWAVAHLGALCERADQGLAALAGQTLVHLDIRADNVLVGSAGEITLVDWPWACIGPVWLDRLMLLVNVRLLGGPDTPALLHDLTARTSARLEDLTAVLVGFAGFFLDITRRPVPPGLPTVRAFQRAQGEALLSWLQELDAHSNDG